MKILLLSIMLFAGCQSNLKGQTASQEQFETGQSVADFHSVALLQLPFPKDSVVYIYNMDMSIFARFNFNDDDEIVCDALENQIVSYYPDWELMTFFCDKYDDKYTKIMVGNTWKLIEKQYIYRIEEMQSFMKSSSYIPHAGDTLYSKNLKTIIREVDDSETEYNIKKVKGDWIEIERKGKSYWFKWKEGSYVLPDRLRYDI